MGRWFIMPREIRDAINKEDRRRDNKKRILRRQPHPQLDSQDDEWAELMKRRVLESARRHRDAQVPFCAIFRVPESIREADLKAYEPSVVAIGPLEKDIDNCPEHLRAMEEYKWGCIHRLLLRHHDRELRNELLDHCLGKMMAEEKRARRCYSKNINASPQELARILLLDGCFILHLLLKQIYEIVEDGEVSATGDDGDSLEENGEEIGAVASTDDEIVEDGEVSATGDDGDAEENGEENGAAASTDDEIVEDGEVSATVDDGDAQVLENGEENGAAASTDDEIVEVVVVKDGPDDGIPREDVADNQGDDVEVVIKDWDTKVEEKQEYGEFREVPSASSLWIWSMVRIDLLKLENQIPFFIIQDLFDLLKTPDDSDVNLVKLALKLFSTLDPHRVSVQQEIPADRVHHLLHLFHLSLLPPPYDTSLTAPTESGDVHTPPPEWIPSATELQEAGVKFKRKVDAVSMLQVTFEDGVMEIPQLHIYSNSKIVFRNLIAFEQCFPVRPYITSYTLFMDCIMRTARDVRLLHLSGIVMNGQSTDEGVAIFFRRVRSGVHFAYDENYLRDLYVKVGRYHEYRWHRWQAVLTRDYFGNPWVVVSVVAAALLLLLTVEQATFSALAYFRPPK